MQLSEDTKRLLIPKGVKTLEEEAEISEPLFAALRRLAEGRLDVPIRSGKML